jgi:hypothetical protein
MIRLHITPKIPKHHYSFLDQGIVIISCFCSESCPTRIWKVYLFIYLFINSAVNSPRSYVWLMTEWIEQDAKGSYPVLNWGNSLAFSQILWPKELRDCLLHISAPCSESFGTVSKGALFKEQKGGSQYCNWRNADRFNWRKDPILLNYIQWTTVTVPISATTQS